MTKLKKQIILSVCLLAFAVGLGAVYFLIEDKGEINPAPEVYGSLEGETVTVRGLDPEKSYLWSHDNKEWTPVDENSESFTYKAGKMCYVKEKGDNSETALLGAYGEETKNSRPYIVPKLDNANMNSIYVKNEEDEYTMLHKNSGAYAIEGLEGYERNEEMFAYLRVNTLNLLALSYVEGVRESDLYEYGIDKDNPKNYFVVTYNDEKDSYKVLVGDKTPDGDGYYAMLDGRDALYVVDTGVENSVLLPRRRYVKPVIVHTVENEKKFELQKFSLSKKGELFVAIEKSSDALTHGNNSSHRITFPLGNNATNLTGFETLLNLLLTLEGTETLLYGEGVTDEALCEYGFFDETGKDISDYSFSYKYPNFTEEIFVVKDGASGELIVYSRNKNIVVKALPETMEFLDWDIILWVSSEVFLLDIEDIKTVSFEADGKRAEFELSGTGSDIAVTLNGKREDINAFKTLYRSVFDIIITSYSEGRDFGREELSMTVVTENGEELRYRFFAHTAQNTYYTLNGFGEFYVSAERVKNVKETVLGFLN